MTLKKGVNNSFPIRIPDWNLDCTITAPFEGDVAEMQRYLKNNTHFNKSPLTENAVIGILFLTDGTVPLFTPEYLPQQLKRNPKTMRLVADSVKKYFAKEVKAVINELSEQLKGDKNGSKKNTKQT